MVDKSYVKFVRRAYDTKNILQCCYGGKDPSEALRLALKQYLNAVKNIEKQKQ